MNRNSHLQFYKSKPVTTPLCKDKTQRLMLFIHHDDPKYNNLSFLLHPRQDKPRLPILFRRNIQTAKEKTKMQLEKSNKAKPRQNYINLNTELIDKMKVELSHIKSSYENETPTHSHIITKTISTFYQNKLTFSSDRVDIQKIKEINPKLGEQILKSQSKLPFSYKKMNKKFKALFNETLTDTFYASRYKKDKININEILVHHNAIVRKDPTPFLVKNYNMKKSLQLIKQQAKVDKMASIQKTEIYSSSQSSSNKLTLENIS